MADVLISSVSNPGCQDMTEMATSRAQIFGGTNGNGVVSCSLKRKRPPKIEIPNVLREISDDILKLRTGHGQTEGSACFADNGVCVFALKGKKKFMEDAHKIFSSPNGDKDFFGVYDGHGGSKAVEFVTENLHLKIFEMLDNSLANKEKEEAVKEGYLKTDEEFLKQGMGSGVCCLTALIEGREMIVSNLGDCRAVLCRDGIAEAITTDHTPGREDERRRIEEQGGYVEFHRGSYRIHGTLAVSRSIGDAHLKDWVIAEPDTTVVRLTPDMEYLVLASDGLWQEVSNQEAIDIVMKSCSKKQLMRQSQAKVVGPSVSPLSNSLTFPLLKSNRIFHHKTSTFHQKTSEDDEQCCENASPPSKSRRISLAKQTRIRTHSPNNENQGDNGLLDACKELVNLAVTRGSLDDITVMVVDLSRRVGRLSPHKVADMNHFRE
ncbi:hypothetical protein CASFOL_006213 [Castilleja foliolosa]|uniref:protein-serine/threonine phosphatase n=1 Tax=Castilleja foliolosa TaxID=1961234 RepID=A0ABD3E9P2_9LAMI